MAKGTQKSNGNDSSPNFEAQLWAAADKMRGHIDTLEYKHVVLGLIFLHHLSPEGVAGFVMATSE